MQKIKIKDDNMKLGWFNKKREFLLFVLIVFSVGIVNAQYPYQDSSLPVETRVDDLISRMTLQEKISQLGHKSSAISRFGVTSYNYWNEAIHGVARSGLATSFPVSIALSSTWNPELVYNVANATSDEARVKNNIEGKGLTYWCPTINMARDPRWGRSEENYGEDVFLTSQIAVNFIKGMQGNDPKYLKTVATAKHFAANNVEYNRKGTSSNMDERSLREYYLPAFKACVTEGKVFSIMSAYNAVNGVPSSANRTLLTNILRNEWGFQGYVVSDCDAVGNVWDSHVYVATAPEATAICVRNGDDLNCGTTFPANAAAAITSGLMKEKDIDQALKRVFKARFLLGEFDPVASVSYKSIPASKLDCQEHRDLALQAAHESIVLLKNQNSFLPLNKDSVQTIAVIGPNANAVQLGGYSGTPSVSVSLLQGIATRYGVDISNGIIEAEDFSSQFGVQTESCNEGGSNVGYISQGDYVSYDSLNFGSGKQKFDVRVACESNTGNIELRLDGLNGEILGTYIVPVTGSWQTWETLSFDIPQITGYHSIYLKFTGVGKYLFNLNWLRFYNVDDIDPTAGDGLIRFAKGCDVTGSLVQADIDKAVNFAKSSDIAIVVLGTDLNVADESNDRTNITLPGVQEQLLKAVYRANPKTVLVLVSGASLAVNWAQDSIPSILSAWYNGQSQGTAITDVLFGDYNPKGKLTTTWYKSTADLPLMSDYNIRNNRTYMYFKGIPLYPFGHGLSYTTFEYSNLKTSVTSLSLGDSIVISADIKNSGEVAGDEVVQMYVHVQSSMNERPIKELKGFANVQLEPDETKTVNVTLKHNALSYYDDNDKTFRVENGQVDIMVGSSSQDIRLTAQIDVTEGTVAETYRQDPFKRIEAEYLESKSNGVKFGACSNGGICVESLNNNSYIAFKNFDFTTEAKQFSALLSATTNANIEIVLDSLDGDKVGTLNIVSTESLDVYKTISCELTRTTGIRDVYLVFKTSVSNAIKLNWISFQKTFGETPDGVESLGIGYKADIFPNPAHQEFTINYVLPVDSDFNVGIYSIQGALLKSVNLHKQNAGTHQIAIDTNTAQFNKGIYIVQFNSNGFFQSQLMQIN